MTRRWRSMTRQVSEAHVFCRGERWRCRADTPDSGQRLVVASVVRHQSDGHPLDVYERAPVRAAVLARKDARLHVPARVVPLVRRMGPRLPPMSVRRREHQCLEHGVRDRHCAGWGRRRIPDRLCPGHARAAESQGARVCRGKDEIEKEKEYMSTRGPWDRRASLKSTNYCYYITWVCASQRQGRIHSLGI